jgi:xanthine dehydrogenase YagS FAD-binding subunit
MHPFVYRRASSAEEAVATGRASSSPTAAPTQSHAQFIAGGTNMTDYMRLNVMQPEMLVDINRLPADRYGRIELSEDGVRFGALVRMADVEDHPSVRDNYPVLVETLQLAATRQIRNRASLAGNVLQRTRCEYFRETSWPCNKRAPGSGCAARDGFNRQHAVLGVSERCIAAYPGDFAQALVALDATVETLGANGRRRRIKFAELHRKPGDTPHIETVLEPGELIEFLDVPAGPWTRRSLYLKVRDRQSYQFALTGAAVALDLDGERVRDVRIALGGVASVPWRAYEAEAVLKGQPLDDVIAARAADAAFVTATPSRHNAFKVPVGKETIVRALLKAKSMKV